MTLHPNIIIYLKNLRTHFNNHPQEYRQLFGDLDKKTCYERIEKIARENHETIGDPVLTLEQYQSVRDIEAPERWFQTLNFENPEYISYSVVCLN